MTVVLICFLHGKTWPDLVSKCQQFAKEREERRKQQAEEEVEASVGATTDTDQGNEDIMITLSPASTGSGLQHSNPDKIEVVQDDGDGEAVKEDEDEGEAMEQNQSQNKSETVDNKWPDN